MNIAFIGQLGLPKLIERDNDLTENRIEALAKQLASIGHDVTVFGTGKHLPTSKNYHGVKAIKKASLNPEKDGGWIYTVLSILSLRKIKPSVVHIHGWKAAALIKLITILISDVSIVWTVDHIPLRHRWAIRFIVKQAQLLTNEITTTTRQLQYNLLNNFGCRVNYVPDGFISNNLPDMPIKEFGLRTGQQYSLLLGQSTASLRHVAKSYKQAGLRKRMIVLQNNNKRLEKEFGFLSFVGQKQGRALDTLIKNAEIVIVADNTIPNSWLLKAMSKGQAIACIADSKYQEIAGITASFYLQKDQDGLKNILKELASRKKYWGLKARNRAIKHFSWERILPDYLTAYAIVKKPVMLDSARAKFFTKLPV